MINPFDEDDFEMPQEYLIELGKIVVSWGKLEALLSQTLAWAMIDDMRSYPLALAAFAHMGFPMRMDALEAMLQLIEKEFADLYRDKVFQPLRIAQEGRNAAMHQLRHASPTEITRSNVKAKRKLKLIKTSVTLQDLKRIGLSIDEAYESLFAAINVPLFLKFKPQQGQ